MEKSKKINEFFDIDLNTFYSSSSNSSSDSRELNKYRHKTKITFSKNKDDMDIFEYEPRKKPHILKKDANIQEVLISSGHKQLIKCEKKFFVKELWGKKYQKEVLELTKLAPLRNNNSYLRIKENEEKEKKNRSFLPNLVNFQQQLLSFDPYKKRISVCDKFYN